MKIRTDVGETCDIFNLSDDLDLNFEYDELKESHNRLRPVLQAAGVSTVAANYSCNAIREVYPPVSRDSAGRFIASPPPTLQVEIEEFFCGLVLELITERNKNRVRGTLTWHLEADTLKVTYIINPLKNAPQLTGHPAR